MLVNIFLIGWKCWMNYTKWTLLVNW
jgi:hypothetical protein